MTRIVAGRWGGRTLVVPSDGTRPTSEKVREAVFSRLDHLGVLEGANVLDLYAGSGALGLEAVSRGAGRAVLVDQARVAAGAAQRNVAALGAGDVVRVVRSSVESFLRRRDGGARWDLVFVDPPYDVPSADLDDHLSDLASSVTAGGLIVVERSTRSVAPATQNWREYDSRSYGETAVYYLGV